MPAGFRGFAKPTVKVSPLSSSAVTVRNTHTAPITVKVGVTESGKTYKAVTKTVKPGAKVTIKLATPRSLRSALAKTLAKSGKVARRPRITVTTSRPAVRPC
jgi:hypothetical protein